MALSAAIATVRLTMRPESKIVDASTPQCIDGVGLNVHRPVLASPPLGVRLVAHPPNEFVPIRLAHRRRQQTSASPCLLRARLQDSRFDDGLHWVNPKNR